MKFTAAGDAIIQKRIYDDYEGINELSPFIKQGDARFFNLEMTLNYEGESCASQFSGGTYLRTNPEVLDDIKKFGFNMTSFNNNHAMDFHYEGFFKTLENVNKVVDALISALIIAIITFACWNLSVAKTIIVCLATAILKLLIGFVLFNEGFMTNVLSVPVLHYQALPSFLQTPLLFRHLIIFRYSRGYLCS